MALNSNSFETARTRKFRESPLCPEDERTIGHIEKFGSSVVSVTKTKHGYGWSYTIGVFDTCGGPELITVGLPPEVAHFALNEAAKRMRGGADLTKGRYRGIVGRVECEFRPVDPKWIKQLMGWAIWYYEGADFPVLQVVYPDAENRFPEDEDFDAAFEQPLIQGTAPMTRVERDFWASTDPKSSLSDWKFPDPPHTGVYLSEAVHAETEPVTYVSHDEEDGAWQFLGPSMAGEGKPLIVCFHHPIDNDPTLAELADLPMGWYAERSGIGQSWARRKHEPDETSD
jgi:hypothetical protein